MYRFVLNQSFYEVRVLLLVGIGFFLGRALDRLPGGWDAGYPGIAWNELSDLGELVPAVEPASTPIEDEWLVHLRPKGLVTAMRALGSRGSDLEIDELVAVSEEFLASETGGEPIPGVRYRFRGRRTEPTSAAFPPPPRSPEENLSIQVRPADDPSGVAFDAGILGARVEADGTFVREFVLPRFEHTIELRILRVCGVDVGAPGTYGFFGRSFRIDPATQERRWTPSH